MLITTRLFIPPLGTKFELAQPWEFTLYNEHRNDRLWPLFSNSPLGNRWNRTHQTVTATMPAGTVLTVSRIYIRQGQGEFNSVSFLCERIPGKSEPGKKKTVGRFWAKLDDVNKIVATIDSDQMPELPADAEDVENAAGMTD